ncbi:MAG: hypothetical protein ABI721_01880 [Candidatus Dojkabacteria bacterium]
MKKVVIALLILIPLCCCCSVLAGFAFIGHFEVNGTCSYKGPFFSSTTGPCATPPIVTPAPVPVPQPQPTTSNTLQYDGKDSFEFTFSYPKKFVLDDSADIIYVYSKDPSLNVAGDFNDNMNVYSSNETVEATSLGCSSYKTELIGSIKDSLNVDPQSATSAVVTVNGQEVCKIEWDGTLSGLSFHQAQYSFTSKFTGNTIYVTISLENGSTNKDEFNAILNSFETL